MARKIIIWIVFGGMAIVLLIAYLGKNRLNNYLSEKMMEQTEPETTLSAEETIQLNYNYSSNGLKFDFSLLEFGSNNCILCKQMEPVLKEIRNSEVLVNVVFIHTMKPENLALMKYFGISAQPMQILLDKHGKEFYRHYGFISTSDLLAKFE